MRLVLLTLVVTAAGCAKDDYANLDKPRQFFAEERIGSSPDWAIIKWDDPDDHVATAHGFSDDGEGCQIMADGLNENACAETDGKDCRNPFSCVPLNSLN